MFKGPKGMLLPDNAATSAALAATTSAVTAAADKTEMCASSLILPRGLQSVSTVLQARNE